MCGSDTNAGFSQNIEPANIVRDINERHEQQLKAMEEMHEQQMKAIGEMHEQQMKAIGERHEQQMKAMQDMRDMQMQMQTCRCTRCMPKAMPKEGPKAMPMEERGDEWDGDATRKRKHTTHDMVRVW